MCGWESVEGCRCGGAGVGGEVWRDAGVKWECGRMQVGGVWRDAGMGV